MDFQTKATSEFKTLSIAETTDFLHSNENGLTDAAVKERLSIFGRNEITEKKKNPVLSFLKRYWGPMPWLLEFAMVLNFVLKHRLEGIIIFALLIDAASSIESSLVTRTPSSASFIPVAAWTIVITAGKATGTALIRKITTNVRIRRTLMCIANAYAATMSEPTIPRYIMSFTMFIIISSWLLEFAMVLNFVLKHRLEGIIIFALL
ncbi:MAG: cation-transporting P-type ATPase, partial [Bacteroidetes bacterium]|nr:cation-transporting P-type ATPase [Bacteroidota bacterium]